MKKELKDKWVAALRSGEYKQGMTVLRDRNNNFCCLGVLCDVAGVQPSGRVTDKEFLFNGYVNEAREAYIYGGDVGFLSNSLLDFFKLDTAFAHLLAKKNDDGVSFVDLAKIIEKRLETED